MAWTGAVYIIENTIRSFYLEHGELFDRLSKECQNRWELIFAVSGKNRDEVAAILLAVSQAANNLSNPPISDYLGIPGNSYVYAYFDQGNVSWNNCFYVGKGTNGAGAAHLGRWTEHIRNTLRKEIKHQTEKERKIHQWIEAQELIGESHSVVRQQATARNLVRKLYVFEGPYAAAQAFYVEHFLISHVLGTHSIANDTNGNAIYGENSALTLPKYLSRTDPMHETVWNYTVDVFVRNPTSPRLNNTCRPAFIALHANEYARALDVCLKGFGVVPHPMSGQGRLSDDQMPCPNIQVTGASDATLTYSTTIRRSYRIELRFGATQYLTSISLRPYSANRKDITAFLAYMDNCQISQVMVGNLKTIPGQLSERYGKNGLVRNRNNWPFYKPFAPDAEGHTAIWFDIKDPNSLASGRTNWIDGGIFTLSLVQAIDLIIKTFP